MASRRIHIETIDVVIREAEIVQFFDSAVGRSVVVKHSGDNLRHVSHPDATDDGDGRFRT